jgi:hypothetical protein
MILQRLITGWNSLKTVRVLLGVLILYSSVAENNTPGIILGTLFTAFALFTDGGCCITRACSTPIKSKNNAITENVEYEELGNQ